MTQQIQKPEELKKLEIEKEEEQIIPEIKIGEALQLKIVLNTDFSGHSEMKEWPMEEDFQGSVLKDVRLTKISWNLDKK